MEELNKEIYEELKKEHVDAIKGAIEDAIQTERRRALEILSHGGTKAYMLKLLNDGTNLGVIEADAALEAFGK